MGLLKLVSQLIAGTSQDITEQQSDQLYPDPAHLVPVNNWIWDDTLGEWVPEELGSGSGALIENQYNTVHLDLDPDRSAGYTEIQIAGSITGTSFTTLLLTGNIIIKFSGYTGAYDPVWMYAGNIYQFSNFEFTSIWVSHQPQVGCDLEFWVGRRI